MWTHAACGGLLDVQLDGGAIFGNANRHPQRFATPPGGPQSLRVDQLGVLDLHQRRPIQPLVLVGPRSRRKSISRHPPRTRQSLRVTQLIAVDDQLAYTGVHRDRSGRILSTDLDDGHSVGKRRPAASVDDQHTVSGGREISVVRKPFQPVPGRAGDLPRLRGDADQSGVMQHRELTHQRADDPTSRLGVTSDGHRRCRRQRQYDWHPTDHRPAVHQSADGLGGDVVGAIA